jgi:hypothetical protein
VEYLVVCPVAFLVGTLTLFSGFGLGTLLTRHRAPTGARILATCVAVCRPPVST